MQIYLIFFIFLFNLGLIPVAISQETTSAVSGKIICLDPGHGGTAKTDSFREGPTGEREEWINLRVASKNVRGKRSKSCNDAYK